jgi:hypothetical protein
MAGVRLKTVAMSRSLPDALLQTPTVLVPAEPARSWTTHSADGPQIESPSGSLRILNWTNFEAGVR